MDSSGVEFFNKIAWFQSKPEYSSVSIILNVRQSASEKDELKGNTIEMTKAINDQAAEKSQDWRKNVLKTNADLKHLKHWLIDRK